MNIAQELLQKLAQQTGKNLILESNCEILTEEQYINSKCEAYNASEGSLNVRDGYNCDKCKNRGYISYSKYDDSLKYWHEAFRECKCQKVRKAIMRLINSGLKNIIKDYTFAKYEATQEWQKILKRKAMEYVNDHNGAWFFIGGQSGAGKTHLCTAIAGCFLKKEKDVKYMLWRDDVMKIKSYITDAEQYHNIMASYKTADVLYIDDLFKNGKDQNGNVQRPTSADVQVAFEILNYRYNNKNLITIISSERTIFELVDIDEATGSRISERSVQNGYGFNLKKDMRKNYRLKNVTEM